MPFPQRDAILFLTLCVIFVTLVLQGLTLPALIRRLGVADQPFEKCEEVQARRIMIDTALSKLEESTDREKPEMKVIYDDVESHYRIRLQALERGERENRLDPRKQDQFEQLAKYFRDAERAAAIQLRDQDRISDEVLGTLLRELDLLDARDNVGFPDKKGDPI